MCSVLNALVPGIRRHICSAVAVGLALVGSIVGVPVAGAASINLGAAMDYSGLGLGGVPITISSGNTTIAGNVGVGVNGSLDFSGGGKIKGRIDKDSTSTVNLTGGSTAAGGIDTVSMASIAKAATDAASNYASLLPTSTLASILSSTSITGNGGQNVIDVTGDINLQGGSKLTLTGTSADTFVFDIAGAMTLGGGSDITLVGVMPSQVLFNLTGTGKAVNLNGNSDSAGIFLDTKGDIIVSGGVHSSEFVSGTRLTFQSGPSINLLPLPESVWGGLLLLGGLGMWRLRCRCLRPTA